MATIQSVDVFPIHLPITRSFTFASGSAGEPGEMAPLILVRVTDSDGEIGWGESRPNPQWSYETFETVVSTIRRYLVPAIIGCDVTDTLDLHRRMFSVVGRGPSTGQPIAKATLDIAVHDLIARRAKLPLRCLLGGGVDHNTVALSYTLTDHDPESLRADIATAREQGFVHFNFKAGVHPETDVACARAIRDAVAPGAFVWADGNQAFNLPAAHSLARGLMETGVDVFEQPVAADQWHQFRELRRKVAIPLAADESLVSPGDFFRFAAEGIVDYLVIKVTRTGGIRPVSRQLAVAEAAGIPFLVSGLSDGMLGKLAACQVALAHGFAGPAALNGSQFMDDSAIYPNKSEFESNGAVHLGDQIGIGIHPDLAGVGAHLVNDF